MIVILDNIRSLHNVGSIFRTADGAGVEKIYLCGFTPSVLDRFKKIRLQIAKTALGAEKIVSWEKASDTVEVISKLKKDGYQIISVEQDKKSVPYFESKLNLPANSKSDKTEKIALIFGHEVKGITKEVLSISDMIIEIPMSGKKESLNVANTAAIILFYLRDKNK